MVRHQVHHAIDTLVRRNSGRTVLHDFLHRHRRGCLAKARKCVNDFTFGNETKNCFPIRHHESANLLCTEPVRCSLDAGFWCYGCDVGALPPQNAFDGHSLLPSGDLVAYLIDLRGSAGLAPAIGGVPGKPFTSTRNISISPRQEAVCKHGGRATDQSFANACMAGSPMSARVTTESCWLRGASSTSTAATAALTPSRLRPVTTLLPPHRRTFSTGRRSGVSMCRLPPMRASLRQASSSEATAVLQPFSA